VVEEGRLIDVGIRGDRAPELTLPHVAVLECGGIDRRFDVMVHGREAPRSL
jgi:hypothetical protein